jgi:hypothetical protein
LPEYPGGTPTGSFSGSDATTQSGGYTFQTADSVKDVMAHFQRRLEADGFEVNTSSFEQGGVVAGGSVTAQGGAGREVNIGAMRDDEGRTAVTVTYRFEK